MIHVPGPGRRGLQITARWLERIGAAELDALFALWADEGIPFHVLVLLPESQQAEIPLIQEVCRRNCYALGGAVFPELLVGDRLGVPGAIVLRVTGAPPPHLLPNVGSADAVASTVDAVAAYVEGALGETDEEASLFCVFDALVPNVATHLDTWYLRLADRVQYFGVNAGNERFTPAPCLFDANAFLGDGLLLQLLPGHPGASLEHGYSVPERIITATSAKGNRIIQIDWRPPLDVYRELMQSEYGVEIDRENFYAQAVHFPFGIVRADGEILVRIPVALGEDGSIACVGEIPPNSVLSLLDARSGAATAPARLVESLRGLGLIAPPDSLLLFYCAGRRLHVGESVATELREILARTGARNLVGAFSLGEVGGSRSGGYPLFHNATLVGVPCPDR